MSLEIKLNQNQVQVIQSDEKNLLIIASAGAGKTTVIIEKVANLIGVKGVPPQQILLLTFSNKAAKQLKERLSEKLDRIAKSCTIGTFHSFALKIIRRHIEFSGLSTQFKIISDNDRNRFVATLARDLGINRYDYREFIDVIPLVKSGKVKIPNKFLNLDSALKKKLKDVNAIELDDLIYIAKNIIQKNPEILDKLRQTYKYVLIDEFQDINEEQYQLILPIVEKCIQFIAVGDDDQCIYEWRGSKPDILLNFSNKTDVKTIKLPENYRSGKSIIQIANGMIGYNKKRILKNMVATKLDDSELEFQLFDNQSSEGKHIVDKIKKITQETPIPYSNIAVLVRNDIQIAPIVDALVSSKIPFINHNLSLVGFRWILNYLRELSQTSIDVSKIINLPKVIMNNMLFNDICEKNGISILNPNQSIRTMVENKITFENSALFQSRYKTFIRLSDMKGKVTILELIYELVISLTNSGENFSPEEKVFFETLFNIARDFLNLEENQNLEQFCDFLELRMDEIYSNLEEGVQILTIHKAKGLEFDVVFIPGISIGNFPNDFFIKTNEDLEAERRLMFVAITRSKSELYMSSYGDKTPSNLNFRSFKTELMELLKEYNLKEKMDSQFKKIYNKKSNLEINSFVENFNSILSTNDELSNYNLNLIVELITQNWSTLNHPYLSREIIKICNGTKRIISDISKKIEISRYDLLSNRGFIYGFLKLILDVLSEKKSNKITLYLTNNSALSIFDSIKIHNQLLTNKKVSKDYGQKDFIYLSKYKNYLDALHHQFEPKYSDQNQKIINEFSKLESIEKIRMVISPLIFLSKIKLSKIDLDILEINYKHE